MADDVRALVPSSRFPLLMFFGSLLLQAAWILAVPPYRGIDEFDHVYRAAAVAHGQWRSPLEPAEDGRGDLVVVPATIVKDAGPVCSRYKYVGPDNCQAVREVSPGMVEVASAASRYHPLFYWLVGTPSLPFEGAAAVYAMRAASALLSSLLVAANAWILGRWARTMWPRAALVVALTPVVVYSSVVPAPNAIEMLSSSALWLALLGAAYTSDLRVQRHLLLAAIPLASALVTVRSTGPMFLGVIVLIAVLTTPLSTLLQLLRSHRRVLVGGSLVVGAAGLASFWWVRVNPTVLCNCADTSGQLSRTISEIPLWFLQTIAAFPIRDEQAPMLVYAAFGVVLVGWALIGFRSADSRLRGGMLATGVASLLAGIGITLALYSTDGPIWQGRYGFPISVGVILLAGMALDRKPPTSRLIRPLVQISWVLVGLSHVVSVVNVDRNEIRTSPLTGDSRWLFHPLWLVGLLAVAGVAVWIRAVHSVDSRQAVVPRIGDRVAA